jgi:predicted phage tail protein
MPAYDNDTLIQSDKVSLVVTANTNIFAKDFAPISTGTMSNFTIYIVPQLAGAFSAFRTVSGTATSKAETFNAGASLVANCGYTFSIPIGLNDTMNFQYSVSTTLTQLKIIETP